MYLIYGSTAIKHWFPDLKREPNDLDVISSFNYKRILEGAEFYWTDAFKYLEKWNRDSKYVDPDFLYTIKLSHLSWDINWDKHMGDVIFLKSKGCIVNEEFYNLLMKDWCKIHGKPRVHMKVRNEEFFKPIINRRFEHDWLHEQLALNGRPMHERIREDLGSPLPSKKLWESLSYQEKLDCAVEELYVLTSERYIFIDKPLPISTAKVKSLKNMITSTTGGWFNLFLKENFIELINYKPDFIINKIKELG